MFVKFKLYWYHFKINYHFTLQKSFIIRACSIACSLLVSLVNLSLLDLIYVHILEEAVLHIEIIKEEDFSVEGESERQMIDVTVTRANAARVIKVE